jgi:hypothetical protein
MEYIPIISLLIAMALILPVAIWLEKRSRDRKRSLIVPDQRKWFGLLMALFLIAGCSSQSEGPSSVSGADSEHIAVPAFPNFPTLPKPPVGTISTTETVATAPTATTPTTTSPVSTGTATESCKYAGRFNGDRMTAYCSKKMSQYPASITIIITGCITKTISNNGSRYESGGLIVKQSEVSGRGMAIVMASSCKSTSASVRY